MDNILIERIINESNFNFINYCGNLEFHNFLLQIKNYEEEKQNSIIKKILKNKNIYHYEEKRNVIFNLLINKNNNELTNLFYESFETNMNYKNLISYLFDTNINKMDNDQIQKFIDFNNKVLNSTFKNYNEHKLDLLKSRIVEKIYQINDVNLKLYFLRQIEEKYNVLDFSPKNLNNIFKNKITRKYIIEKMENNEDFCKEHSNIFFKHLIRTKSKKAFYDFYNSKIIKYMNILNFTGNEKKWLEETINNKEKMNINRELKEIKKEKENIVIKKRKM